jgi:hypothetical protein
MNTLTNHVIPNGKEVVKINTFGKFTINNDDLWARLLAENANGPVLPMYEESPDYWDKLLDDIVDELSKDHVIGLTSPVFEQYRVKIADEIRFAYQQEYWAIYATKTKQRKDFRK